MQLKELKRGERDDERMEKRINKAFISPKRVQNKKRKNPGTAKGLKTFELPTNEQLVKLKEGSIVKLIFTDTHGKNGERMWVKITKKLGDGNFEGELDNVPIGLKMKLGDKVKFNAGEIINIEK